MGKFCRASPLDSALFLTVFRAGEQRPPRTHGLPGSRVRAYAGPGDSPQSLDQHYTLPFPGGARRVLSQFTRPGVRASSWLFFQTPKGLVNDKDGAGSRPQTLAGSCARAAIFQPWSPSVLQVFQLLKDELEEWRSWGPLNRLNSGGSDSQVVFESTRTQPPASLL